MNWYHRAESRYVEYGSSFRAALRFGLGRQLTDLVYNMNGAHLAPDALTVFERLDRRRPAHRRHDLSDLPRPPPAAAGPGLGADRIAALALVRRPVMGPRELFYADIFSSRDTGCRGTLGLPGVRDQHAGCVGDYLVRHDCSTSCCSRCPTTTTLAQARPRRPGRRDRAGRPPARPAVSPPAGGTDQFLAEHAVIVVADHAHTLIERAVSLGAEFSSFDVRRPTDMRPVSDSQIAVCPAQRAAMIYVLGPSTLERVIARAQRIAGVEQVIWREAGEVVVARDGSRLRLAPGDE